MVSTSQKAITPSLILSTLSGITNSVIPDPKNALLSIVLSFFGNIKLFDPNIPVEKELFTFSIMLKDNTIAITGLTEEGLKETEIVIPETLGDKTVKEIRENAFKDNSTLQTLSMPDTIEKIGKSAFQGCECIVYPFSVQVGDTII